MYKHFESNGIQHYINAIYHKNRTMKYQNCSQTFSTIPLIISHFAESWKMELKKKHIQPCYFTFHLFVVVVVFFISFFFYSHSHSPCTFTLQSVLMLSHSLSILIESFFFGIVFADIINTKSWYTTFAHIMLWLFQRALTCMQLLCRAMVVAYFKRKFHIQYILNLEMLFSFEMNTE